MKMAVVGRPSLAAISLAGRDARPSRIDNWHQVAQAFQPVRARSLRLPKITL